MQTRTRLRRFEGLTILLACFIAGCSSPTKQQTAADFAAACTVTRDAVRQETLVLSTTEKFIMPDQTGYLNYYFVAAKPDRGPIEYGVVVASLRTEWAYWQQATDAQGRNFPLVATASREDSGSFAESATTAIDRNYLDATASSTTAWTIKGLRAAITIQLHSIAAQGFRDRCEKEFAGAR